VAAINARIVSLDDEFEPGWARVVVRLAGGTEVESYEKWPVLGIEGQRLGEVIPLMCDVLASAGGRSTVRLAYGIETVDGRHVVEVDSVGLTDLD
jgi:hypothetical protein